MQREQWQGEDTLEFKEAFQRRRVARMEAVDRMTPEVRELVHEYGLTVVRACTDLGIIKARHIRHLVETVLNEFSPTRGSASSQGPRAAFGIVPPADED